MIGVVTAQWRPTSLLSGSQQLVLVQLVHLHDIVHHGIPPADTCFNAVIIHIIEINLNVEIIVSRFLLLVKKYF